MRRIPWTTRRVIKKMAGERWEDGRQAAPSASRHGNGSVSSVACLAGGDKAFPKERVEVVGGGRVAVI